MSAQYAKDIAAEFQRKSDAIQSKFATRGTFSSVDDLAKASGLDSWTQQNGSDFLSAKGISKVYAAEIVEPITRGRFGLLPEALNSYEMGMALYDAEYTIGKSGGSLKSLLESMLEESNANVRLGTNVFGLRKLRTGSGLLGSRSSAINASSANYDQARDAQFALFDKVILAAPFAPS